MFRYRSHDEIVIKLKEPLVYALEWFASFGSFSGNMVLVPKETDSTFEIKGDMIGTGPFFLSDYRASQGFVLKRNPDYFDPDFALIDQFEAPIVAGPCLMPPQGITAMEMITVMIMIAGATVNSTLSTPFGW